MPTPHQQTTPNHAERLQRQSLLTDFGQGSASKLQNAHAVVLGLGALGSVAADLLARAGVGTLTLIDRDIVEHSNLHRQTLYNDNDAASATPKAIAAAHALNAANPTIKTITHTEDFTNRNAERLASLTNDSAHPPTVLLDCTDNFPARFLLNDLAVKHARPMIYAGAVATRAAVATILPLPAPAAPTPPWLDQANPHRGHGPGPCLRCIAGSPPPPGTTETCDTAGVLGTVSAAAAAFQATEALKIILARFDKLRRHLLAFDPWNTNFNRIDLSPNARDPHCPCCAERAFHFLDAPITTNPEPLCGRDAVQLPPTGNTNLQAVAERLQKSAKVRLSPAMLLIEPHDQTESIALFADGRAIVRGTDDPARARAIADRYIGA